MDRRTFLAHTAASLAATVFAARLCAQQAASPQKATLRVNSASSLATMPLDFTGLSYESAQLTNPGYFSADNTDLIGKFRRLGTNGVLRLGGHLSNLTIWQDDHPETLTDAQKKAIEGAKNAYEWLTVDSVGGRNREGVVTPLAIRNLRGFLDATGWKLLYGLNTITGTAQRAAIESAYVHDTIGPHLLAFQVGNEADRFRNPATHEYISFDEFWETMYEPFVKTVRSKVPRAAFAGPDTSRRAMDWELAYARRAAGDTVLITSHYYDGAASNEDLAGDTQHLLLPDPGLRKQDIPKALEAAKIAGVPYRMSEGNSRAHGGEDNLSNAYASALWGADYMLFLAQSGVAGVNLHGGGNGRYSPIVGEVQSGFTERPVYWGMLMAGMFAGYTFLESTLDAGDVNMTAYVAQKSGSGILLAVLNKDARTVSLGLDKLPGKSKQAWALTGQSLNSEIGVQLKEIDAPRRTPLLIPAYSGLLVHFA